MNLISKKICLVGDFGVGKTSLVRRFVEGIFSDRYLSTVGVKISRKTVEIATLEETSSANLQLLIWDIEGQTKFKAIAQSYLQGAAGAILVADVTRPETLESLSQHIQLFQAVNPKGAIAIAYNKTDLMDKEHLAFLLKENAVSNPAIIATYSTSAKTGLYVDDLFQVLSSNIIEGIHR
ncbi:MAG: GTP-binding protein [Desertifilum sp.]|nr:GTP-binding protein [Desertifilum sp.]